MARKGGREPQIKTRPIGFFDGVLLPFLLVLFLLIKIGNGLKFILKIIVRTCRQLFQQISRVVHQLADFARRITLGATSFRFTRRIKITIPRIKIYRPQIPFPKIPPIHFPQLQKLRYFFLGVIFTLIFVFLPYQAWTWLSRLPHPQLLSVREIPVTTKIFDRNGFLLYEIYAEQNRTPVTLAEIPQFLQEATIAIEDKDFYKHPGFSLRGIARATRETLLSHRLQGGSTITQQLVRSALLTPEPTISRKIKEIVLSFWAERLYGKDQILEMYFNQVPYGGTAWGVEAASQTYFGKSVTDLSLAEAAFLAALPSAPSIYSPYGTHPELGLARQKEVLQKMVEQGFVTQTQEIEATSQNLQFAPPKTEIKAPHFVMYVKDLLEKKYGPRLVQMGGLRITTSLDMATQEMAQEIVNNEVEKLAGLKVGNGAALITKPVTGEILAMVGSRNYFDLAKDGNVNTTLSSRQPGSSIKVVNYALALEKGFTAATVLDDSPITFQVAGQPPYSPVNYDGQYHGKVTLRTALASSYNVPAVKVLAKLGVKNMIDKGRQMGITSWQNESRYGLSLTLGGGEVTMFDMARVYGTIANQGRRQNLTAVLKVTDYKGQVLEEARSNQGFPAVPPAIAFILANILADNHARTPAFGANSLLIIPGKTVSVKTGTSNDLRDNWAIGFTPAYVIVTWVGNNDNSPMSYVASGITGATPIWQQIMINLLKDKPDEPILPPEDVILINTCGRFEYFIKGSEKSVSCPPPPSPSPTPSS